MRPAEELAIKYVTRRVDDMPLAEAIKTTAAQTGLSESRIESLWQSFEINPVQERIIEFLKRDHGPCKIASLLPQHPLACELDLQPQQHLFIEFSKESFIVLSDGGFSPTAAQL